jgi:hypothetical protein
VAGKHITMPLFARESSAFRFPAILMAGFGVALAYLFARRFLGRIPPAWRRCWPWPSRTTSSTPRSPASTPPSPPWRCLVGYAYWRSLRSRRWAILCGVFYGLAFATKLNAWLMPFFLGCTTLAVIADLRAGQASRGRPGPSCRWPPWAAACSSRMWPYLWPDPGPAAGYFNRHLDHEHYNFEYLGLNWNLPPKDWDLRLLRTTFPFVSTFFTVPATTLVLAVAGGVALLRRKRKDEGAEEDAVRSRAPTPSMAPGIFLATQIFGPMCVLAIPSAPIFGGVKHFLPAVPYWPSARHRPALADPGGRQAGGSPRCERALAGGAGGGGLPAAVSRPSARTPTGSATTTSFAGGFAGGASLGMNRQFWGYSVLPMLPWMASTPRAATPSTGTTCCPTPSTCTCATAPAPWASETSATNGGQHPPLGPGHRHPREALHRVRGLTSGPPYGTTQPPTCAPRGRPAGHRLPPPGSAMSRFEAFLSTRKALVDPVSGLPGCLPGRQRRAPVRHSPYNHFVWLADCWLHGRLALAGQPAQRERLGPGRGAEAARRPGGEGEPSAPATSTSSTRCGRAPETITPDEIESRSNIRYVSFPPLPAVLMVPFVAIWGLSFNDVLFSVMWAAINPVLLFLLLRDLPARALEADAVDDLWLDGAVRGRLGVLLHGLRWAGLVHRPRRGRHLRHRLRLGGAGRPGGPGWAGLCLGLGFAARTPMVYMFPLFVLEAVRGGPVAGQAARAAPACRRGCCPGCLRFGAGAAFVVALLFIHNFARFESFTEFGHRFLNISWKDPHPALGACSTTLPVAQPGLRAGAVAAHSGPRPLRAGQPAGDVAAGDLAQPGLHGDAEGAQPAGACAVADRRRHRHPLAAVPELGYYQFGYRFSLDYMIFLVMLLAVGNRRLSWLFKTLVVIAAGINSFGAITFESLHPVHLRRHLLPHGNN